MRYGHASTVLFVTAALKGLVVVSFCFNRGVVRATTRTLEDGVEAEKAVLPT